MFRNADRPHRWPGRLYVSKSTDLTIHKLCDSLVLDNEDDILNIQVDHLDCKGKLRRAPDGQSSQGERHKLSTYDGSLCKR